MFEQVKLTYGFKDLEPYIDELTMETHYTKHHATYTKNFNEALLKEPVFNNKSIKYILSNLNLAKSENRTAIENNGGQYYNHNLYFATLSPNANPASGRLLDQINADFGDFNAFRDAISQKAVSRFGSGWAFLYVDDSNHLKISSSSNQSNPIIENLGTPIMTIDVWEHAYYLKYKNLRGDYVNALFSVIDFEKVADLFGGALQ